MSALPFVMELRRIYFGKTATIGELYLDGVRECHTLEDPVRDGDDGILQKEEKIYGETAIPAGRYEIILSFSNRFNRLLPLLLNVPHFQGIRIHPGNKPEHTHGCILVGNWEGGDKEIIGDSRATFARIFVRILEASAHGKVFIDIVQSIEQKAVA